MVVTATVDSQQPTAGRLRPLDPAQDMGSVAELIATAFGDEMDSQGRAAIRELRWMARLSPLVWWLAQADPTFREAYNGFVWDEPLPDHPRRRQVVGNANLSRAPGNRGQWVICNVVVRESYRRRGIARRLVEATIAEAQMRGADGVVLQVYQDNWPAYHLYDRLGFEAVAGETGLRLEKIEPAAVEDVPGYQVRPWQPDDGARLYELALSAVPAPVQWLRRVRPADYQPDRWTRASEWMAGLLAGRRIYRLVAVAGGEPVGMLAVEASFRRGPHRLSLLVDLKHRGRVERLLVAHGLRLLHGLPGRGVLVTVSRDHKEALQVFGELGFREQRTLLTLSYQFNERGARSGYR